MSNVKKYFLWRTNTSVSDQVGSKKFKTAEEAMADAETFLLQTGPHTDYIEIFELIYVVKKGETPVYREYVSTNYPESEELEELEPQI